MKALIEFTRTSFEGENPSPFGGAVYDNETGECIAQAYDTVMADGNPLAHGEMNAIRLACAERKSLSLSGCTLYSTCEPCPMCMSGSIWAELDAVYYGASTQEDANVYWPQPSNITPQDLVNGTKDHIGITVVPDFLRPLCAQLFVDCDAARVEKGLANPPNREEGSVSSQ